jgi:hypothetical protein
VPSAPPETPDRETIQKLTEIHLARYGARLAAALEGRPGYRIVELQTLLKIWEGVRAKNYEWDLFDGAERGEVMDAYWDQAGG